MLVFRLNPSSGVPPYLQLAQQIRQALLAGALNPGDQLPTVKEVVGQVAVNPNTVYKSYQELEREGLVEGRPGSGTFVVRRPAGPPPATHARLAKALAQWVERARRAGLDNAAMEAMLDAALADGEAVAS